MLTVKEAAVRACVCESIVRKWIKDGTLPHFRVGAAGKRGKILIEVTDLEGVMAGFKVTKNESGPMKARTPRRTAFKHLKLT